VSGLSVALPYWIYREGRDMARFKVSLFCTDCWDLHTIVENIELREGPEQFGRLQDIFRKTQMPAKLQSLLHRPIICPKTKKQILDPERIYLVRQPGNRTPQNDFY
jgi:hypothetical protein